MTLLDCIEVGGSSVETVTFALDGTTVRAPGARHHLGATLAIATPGIVGASRVIAASNIGWYDVDPAVELGVGVNADIVLNDAEAAALGEVALRDDTDDAVFVCLGTGVGGAVVVDGAVVASNLFGHATGYSDMACVCGRVGCLETIAGGWALPERLGDHEVAIIGRAVADAVEREPLATPDLVVVGGGLARRYPAVIDAVAAAVDPWRLVEPSAAPAGFKSAAAWGLRAALRRAAMRA
ncbi:MAG TPA: ROK family protein [Acidimicrobiales bacterium]|nr:ROK family protein [Acidimicrobiales bacterium]